MTMPATRRLVLRTPGPFTPLRVNDAINHLGGGRGVHVRDPDGIAYEFFTAVP